VTAAVALGFVGAAALATLVRVGIGGLANRPDTMAWGTLAVNVGGSLVLGLLAGASSPVLTMVGTGGMGALTTFSGFARDVAIAARRSPPWAVAYVAATLAAGLAGARLGIELAPAG
jgi:fluoride exporter